MKILVCITHVPDTTSKISFTEGDTKFNSAGVQYIIGPYDDFALARAVEIKEAQGADITVLNVGEGDTEPTLRKALAIGADKAVRIDANPVDGWFVAKQIANYAAGQGFDMIFMGRESIDFNGGQVHGLVGELLNLPAVTPVMKLELSGNTATLTREIEGGTETVTVDLPFIAGCQEPIAEWRIPNMRGIMSARTKPLEVIAPAALDAAVETQRYEMPPARSGCKFVGNANELVQLLKSEAKVI